MKLSYIVMRAGGSCRGGPRPCARAIHGIQRVLKAINHICTNNTKQKPWPTPCTSPPRLSCKWEESAEEYLSYQYQPECSFGTNAAIRDRAVTSATPAATGAFRARGRVVWAAGVPAGLGRDNVCIDAAHLQPAKKIGQMMYLRAATALWRRATHSPLGRGCRAMASAQQPPPLTE